MTSLIIIHCRYQRPSVWGGCCEDYPSRPMRAAARIQFVNFSEPFRPLRSLFFSLRSRVNSLQKSSRCVREGFHLSALLVAPAYEKQLSTGAFRDVRNPIRGHGNA